MRFIQGASFIIQKSTMPFETTFVTPFVTWHKQHLARDKTFSGSGEVCLRCMRREKFSKSPIPQNLVLLSLASHGRNASKQGTPKRKRVSVERRYSSTNGRRSLDKLQQSRRPSSGDVEDIDVGLSKSERLQKVLSRLGVASRREAEQLIVDGRIRVNGKRRTELGTNVNVWEDKIIVNGVVVSIPSSAVWLAIHKPRGFISTTIGNRSLERFLNPRFKGLIPTGAIEEEASGLVILTNERGAVPALIRSDSPHAQRWLVCCRDVATVEQIERLNAGVVLNGQHDRPIQASVSLLEYGKWDLSPKERVLMCLLEIRLRDCRHRVVRRICESVGLSVVRMNRRSIGPVLLDGIRPGKYRELRAKEIKALKRGVSKETLSKSKY